MSDFLGMRPKQIGFERTTIQGVYGSKYNLLSTLKIISLNELSDAPYNLWIKLFSSQKKQKLLVFKKVLALGLKKISYDLLQPTKK